MAEERCLTNVIEVNTHYETGFCVSASVKSTPTTKHYWDWENDIASPALVQLGYKIICWKDGDRDDFGPLSRIALVEKDGVQSEMWYG
jgi:hypothetical protein